MYLFLSVGVSSYYSRLELRPVGLLRMYCFLDACHPCPLRTPLRYTAVSDSDSCTGFLLVRTAANTCSIALLLLGRTVTINSTVCCCCLGSHCMYSSYYCRGAHNHNRELRGACLELTIGTHG